MILSVHMHPKPSFTLFCKQIYYLEMISSLSLALVCLQYNQQPGEASRKDPNSHITKIWCLQVKAKKDTDFSVGSRQEVESSKSLAKLLHGHLLWGNPAQC